jgi:DNA-directed RNA polymerase specialized sigma24 family protein
VTLVLATVEQLPYKQIAEILEIPEGTVAWRVNEARRILRERLGAAEVPPAQTAATASPSPRGASPGKS